MSLILDALRKMEQERKARQGAAQELRPEVLRYRARITRKQGKLPVIVSLFLVAVAVGAASFYIGKRDAGKFAMQHPAVQESAPGGSTEPPEAVPPVAAGPTSQPPATAPYLPWSRTPASAPIEPDTFATPSSNGRSSATAVENFTGANAKARRDAAAAAVPAHRSTATLQHSDAAAANRTGAQVSAPEARLQNRSAAEAQQPAPSDITISGIAFQDERHLRRAVINGILVGEGEEVAGARVIEIKEHKVRMSRGGRQFDVPFGSGTSGM